MAIATGKDHRHYVAINTEQTEKAKQRLTSKTKSKSINAQMNKKKFDSFCCHFSSFGAECNAINFQHKRL